MWYEVLPTVAIIAAGLGLPHVAAHYLCLQVYGTVSKLISIIILLSDYLTLRIY